MKQFTLSVPGHDLRVIPLPNNLSTREAIERCIFTDFGIPSDQYWLDISTTLEHAAVHFRLLGGKGGFGSNLRAQGNKMSARKRSGGNDACRDLSGRRLRTVNETKLIAEYLKREPELERKREAEIREKMLKALEAPNKKPIFEDVGYMRALQESQDTVESAVYEALLGQNGSDDGEESDLDDKGKEKIKTIKNGEASGSASISV